MRFLSFIDPLVRLLVVAILLATFWPATGPQRVVAQSVADGAIVLLFLLNGLRLPRHEVAKGIRNARFLLPLIVWCFFAMGLFGYGLGQIGGSVMPPEIMLGFIFLGVLPSTVQSATAYSSIAGGNVASSVVAAAVINILGVFLTAPLFSLLAGSEAPPFDLVALERIGLLLLLPFAIGQIAQGRLGWLVRDHRLLASWMDRASIAIAVYVAFSGAVEQGLWGMVNGPVWAMLIGLIIPFLLFGFGGAWLFSGRLNLSRPDRIAFLFAGGQKSIALGAPLASVLFPPAMAGLVLLPVLAYHLLQMVLSAPLAARIGRPAEPIAA